MRPFSSRDEGKDWFIKILRNKGFKVVDTDYYRRTFPWDIEAEKDGKICLFELKNRDFPSTKYGDVTIEESKVRRMLVTPFRCFLVYFFEDRWTLIDLRETPYSTIVKKHPKTTRFQDDDTITTTWARWDINNIRMLHYR